MKRKEYRRGSVAVEARMQIQWSENNGTGVLAGRWPEVLCMGSRGYNSRPHTHTSPSFIPSFTSYHPSLLPASTTIERWTFCADLCDYLRFASLRLLLLLKLLSLETSLVQALLHLHTTKRRCRPILPPLRLLYYPLLLYRHPVDCPFFILHHS